MIFNLFSKFKFMSFFSDMENNYQDKNHATCISIKTYCTFYNQLKENHFTVLDKEFKSINEFSSNISNTQNAAKLHDIKNRYTNIYPCKCINFSKTLNNHNLFYALLFYCYSQSTIIESSYQPKKQMIPIT